MGSDHSLSSGTALSIKMSICCIEAGKPLENLPCCFLGLTIYWNFWKYSPYFTLIWFYSNKAGPFAAYHYLQMSIPVIPTLMGNSPFTQPGWVTHKVLPAIHYTVSSPYTFLDNALTTFRLPIWHKKRSGLPAMLRNISVLIPSEGPWDSFNFLNEFPDQLSIRSPWRSIALHMFVAHLETLLKKKGLFTFDEFTFLFRIVFLGDAYGVCSRAGWRIRDSSDLQGVFDGAKFPSV